MKAKHKILNLFITVCALPVIILKPLRNPSKRIFNLIRAKTKLPGLNPTVQIDGKIDIVGTANIILDDYARIGDNVQLGTEEGGKISLGKHVRLNRGTTIFAYSEITIGDYSLIGEFVTIRDANHSIKRGEYIKTQGHDSKPVKIGNDVWIGRGVCILPGVTIGDGCIVGANSVVTKSFEPNMILAGIPAKVLKER